MNRQDRRQPNILWIVSEDCPPRFGCYGDVHARTPHLDQLALSGTLFEQAFSASPVCAPSRFGLLTGVDPVAHGPAHHMRASAHVPGWMHTLPELLRDAGYYCTNNVKTDYNSDVDPDRIWDECSRDAHWRNRPAGMPFAAVFNIDGTHESAVFHRRSPQVDPAAVRVPEYLPDTPEIRADIARYYRDIEEMDAVVGGLLEQLHEDEIADETVVIHTSDHGGVGPRSKRHCYDEGLHVPLIVTLPNRLRSRLGDADRVSAPVSILDLPATVLDAAGIVRPDHWHSRSLLDRSWSEDAKVFSGRGRMDERDDLVRTVRTRRYRYLHNFMPHRPAGQHCAFAWVAEGYRSWEREHLAGDLTGASEAFWRPRPTTELYDLEADPDQMVNLAGRPETASLERELASDLRERMLAVRDNGLLAETDPRQGHQSGGGDQVPFEEILTLAEAASHRSADASLFEPLLRHDDRALRRWAALGLLMLGPRARAARDALAHKVSVGDDDPFVTIPAVEALAGLDEDDEAIRILAEFATKDHSSRVRLEAINALTYLPTATVRSQIAVIERAATDPDEYLRAAGEYLRLRLIGEYRPESPVFRPPSTSDMESTP